MGLSRRGALLASIALAAGCVHRAPVSYAPLAPARVVGPDGPLLALPRVRRNGAFAWAAGRLVVLGAEAPASAGGLTRGVDVYDLDAGVWREGAPAPDPVANPMVAAVDEKLLAAGGCVNADCALMTTAAREYDPAAGRWTELAPLPERLVVAAAGAFGGSLYVFGGAAPGWRNSPRAYALDVAAGRWRRLKDMPVARSHFAGAFLDGKFYAVGGCVGPDGKPCAAASRRVDVYDPAANAWTEAPSLPETRIAHAAWASGGRLWIAGGNKAAGGDALADSWSLAPGERRWRPGPALARPSNLSNAALIGGRAVLFACGAGETSLCDGLQLADGGAWSAVTP